MTDLYPYDVSITKRTANISYKALLMVKHMAVSRGPKATPEAGRERMSVRLFAHMRESKYLTRMPTGVGLHPNTAAPL